MGEEFLPFFPGTAGEFALGTIPIEGEEIGLLVYKVINSLGLVFRYEAASIPQSTFIMSGNVASNAVSGGSSGSGRKGRKRKHAHERDSQVNKKDYPSAEAAKVVKQVVLDYLKDNDIMRLNLLYVRHGNEGFLRFQHNMEMRMREALAGDEWEEDRAKFQFTKWMEDRAHDATWNLRQTMDKFVTRTPVAEGRMPTSEEELFVLVDWWSDMAKAHAKRRTKPLPWKAGSSSADAALNVRYISTNAQVQQLDAPKQGGYGTIRRVRIVGDQFIPPSWELAGKTPRETNAELAKVQHNNEALAVKFHHFGIIKYFALHPRRNEGYTHWWNGGTIRSWLSIDRKWGNDRDNRELMERRGTEQEMQEVNRLV